MEENNPNSFDKEIENVQNTNSQPLENVTEQKETVQNPLEELAPAIDYKEKFTQSSREALRLLEEKKELERKLAEQERFVQSEQPIDNLYPGFETLDEESQKNLIEYTNQIAKKAKEEIYKDPAIAFAKSSYNEKIWNDAFNTISNKYPELAESRDEFKSKYYHVNNVPSNIENVLDDVAKIYLFDKAKSIGAKEEAEKLNRNDIQRATGGDRAPSITRTLEDWEKMAQNNPQKFSQLHKEYQSDLESGRI